MNKKLLIPVFALVFSLVSLSLAGEIGVIVNKDLYPSVKAAVDNYVADVESIEKKDVWLDATSYNDNNTPQELKADFQEHFANNALEGVVFVGDLPLAKYNEGGDVFVCDLYYMDLDGSWSGSGSTFSNHGDGSGDDDADIWVTRLVTSVLTSYSDYSEAEIINRYFARVTKRMHGQDPMERKYCIAGQNQHWSGLENENQGDLGYETANITIHRGNCGTEWKNSIVEGQEYGFVYSHSSPTMHEIGFNMSGIYSNDLDCRFFNSYACSNADYERANMCGGYATSNEGLICFGSAKTGSVRPGCFGYYNEPLGAGDNFGEAFMKFFQVSTVLNDMYWHGGMNVQGAGTLLLKPYASGPYVAVLSPNGGEKLEQFTTHSITWGSNVGGNVKVDLYKGGALNKTLAASIANSGSLEWIITTDFVVGDDYKIKITSLENDTCIDESNADFSITPELILSVPYKQPFDDWGTREMAPWVQLTDDDMDWTVISGATPSRTGSSPDQTGAEADHTSGNGKYIYTEASSNEDKKMSLLSPKFDFRYLNEPKLTVWYHMFSQENTMGNFYVDVKVGTADWQEGVISISGDQGDSWKEKTIELAAITQKNQRVRFRLRGITGSSWCSDICIDDFEIHGTGVGINTVGIIPSTYNLGFNKTRIQYYIPDVNKNVHVNIKLYNIQGKLIKILVDKAQKAGSHFVDLNSSEHKLAAGIYMCKMEVAGFQKTIKVVNK
jgi:hypothetical protein